jgi:mono/diheme cytochrome c family protein
MDMRRYIFAVIFLIPLIISCKRPPYTSGKSVYQGECVQCHKLNGEGGDKGPDLTKIFVEKNEQYIRAYTADPRSLKPDSVMPPAKLSDPELNLLVEYLKEQNHRAADGAK